MNGISVKHLRYFGALARCGHFGRAAEECAITQPALSVQIKERKSRSVLRLLRSRLAKSVGDSLSPKHPVARQDTNEGSARLMMLGIEGYAGGDRFPLPMSLDLTHESRLVPQLR